MEFRIGVGIERWEGVECGFGQSSDLLYLVVALSRDKYGAFLMVTSFSIEEDSR